MRRGEIWWATLPEPRGSEPGYRRPRLVVQADDFNRSAIQTAICVVVTGNLNLAAAPGNVRLGTRVSGLPRPSVANVSQVLTVDRRRLTARVKTLAAATMSRVDAGLRQVLSLPPVR